MPHCQIHWVSKHCRMSFTWANCQSAHVSQSCNVGCCLEGHPGNLFSYAKSLTSSIQCLMHCIVQWLAWSTEGPILFFPLPRLIFLRCYSQLHIVAQRYSSGSHFLLLEKPAAVVITLHMMYADAQGSSYTLRTAEGSVKGWEISFVTVSLSRETDYYSI